MNLLYKIKRLLGFHVDMVVIFYCAGLRDNMTREEYRGIIKKLQETYNTERVLMVPDDVDKIEIQYF